MAWENATGPGHFIPLPPALGTAVTVVAGVVALKSATHLERCLHMRAPSHRLLLVMFSGPCVSIGGVWGQNSYTKQQNECMS